MFNDYRQATRLYTYPDFQAGPVGNPGRLLQGEVREGEQFAYWQEWAYDPNGQIYLGRMVVFLKEDLPLLREKLSLAWPTKVIQY